MRRVAATAVLFASIALASCADSRRDSGLPSEPQAPGKPAPQAVAPAPGTCTTLDHLIDLTNALFGAGSPNANAVLGKLDNLQHQIDIGDFAAAKAHALDIVRFVMAKWETGGLPGTEAQMNELSWGVLCYAGFDVGEFDPNGTVVILASDTETQDGYRRDDQAGFVAPPGAFDVPDGTPVVITMSPAQTALQNTKLDQYPAVFDFNASADLSGNVVVGVCLAVFVDPGVRARLRLGHDLPNSEFEITPAADPPPGLNCPEISATWGLPSWLAKLVRAVLPREAFAVSLGGGGVGGSAGQFSPFGPIDPTVSATGGVGGSAGQFAPPALIRGAGTASVVDCSNWPVGSSVSSECRPEVTVTTFLGTILTDVPVDYTVESGGGTVAPETAGACGTFADSVRAFTDAAGKARSCWDLGTTGGINTVRGRPRVGGEAPEGITFSPPSWVFTTTANPPDHLEFSQQPTSTTAGQTITPAPTVVVHDVNHNQIPIATGLVSLTLSSNSFAAGSTTQVNAVAGLASFSTLSITAAGTGYTIAAAYPGLPTVTSAAFDVAPAPAALIKTYMPPSSPVEAQAYDFGTGLVAYTEANPDPQIRVTDQYGNPVGAGTSVYWTAETTNGATLTVNGGGATSASGIAQVSAWTLGDGLNLLTASLYASEALAPPGFLTAQFSATTPTGISVFACSPGTGNAKTDVAPMSIPAPNGSIKRVTFWMSVTGQSSALSDYDATLEARLNGLTGTLLKSTTGKVQLPGDNGKAVPVTFTFPTSIAKQSGGAKIWFKLTIATPSTRKPQVWYLNSTFKNNDPCANSLIWNAGGTSIFRKGLSINVTN